MSRLFPDAVKVSHRLVREVLKQGDTAIDATAGNGGDTVFMADLVGESGKVYAFDIQREALNKTKEKLAENNFLNAVELVYDGHENMDKYISKSIKAVMFNLGYLPGRDHSVITKPETTLKALEKACCCLENDGIITIVIYIGHEGSKRESRTVNDFVTSLPQSDWDAAEICFPNRKNFPPYLVTLQKR